MKPMTMALLATLTITTMNGVAQFEQPLPRFAKFYNVYRYTDEIDPMECTFDVVPTLYMQDYDNVYISDTSIAESGNLIVCLCMIDSYIEKKWIEPPEFLDEYGSYFSTQKPDIDKLSEQMKGDYTYIHEKFDFEIMSDYIKDKNACVMVRIPHKSIYGEDSTYLLVTRMSGGGMLGVRDPNKLNQDLSPGVDFLNDPLYYAADVITAAGDNTDMYVYYMEDEK